MLELALGMQAPVALTVLSIEVTLVKTARRVVPPHAGAAWLLAVALQLPFAALGASSELASPRDFAALGVVHQPKGIQGVAEIIDSDSLPMTCSQSRSFPSYTTSDRTAV
jgi:hypothetical protein